MASEQSPLLEETLQNLKDAYGSDSHAKIVKDGDSEVLTDYEPLKLSSFRVFCSTKATILNDPVLISEQVVLTIVFFLCAAPVVYFFRHDTGAARHGDDMSVRRFISHQEGKMRAFAQIMTNLAAFLLSFYTSISVSRWWAIRTGGVGGIKAATVDLELLLYQNVTKEPEVLSAIRRYGRASLVLIFIWRRGELADLKTQLVSRDLLTEQESDQLLKWNHCLHETIWAWQAGIVTMLYREGKIKSEHLFNLLIQRCIEGRAAVQQVHTHLAVRVPMQYVHLLGLLVKMHNLVMAIIMGILFGAAFMGSEVIICTQCFARTLILPFLFNAILLINAELSDPFNGGITDFPGMIYQGALEKDCIGFIEASKNMPDWVAQRSEA